MELFFIIAFYDTIINVKIALCKLLKKILSNDNSACYGELSIYGICKIILNKHKNLTISNIFKDISIKEIDEKNKNIFNQYITKYKDKENIFIRDNKYFIQEFNIDYEEDKKPYNSEKYEYIKENENIIPKQNKNSHIDNKSNNISENSSTEFFNVGTLFQKTENNIGLLNKVENLNNINNLNNENNIYIINNDNKNNI